MTSRLLNRWYLLNGCVFIKTNNCSKDNVSVNYWHLHQKFIKPSPATGNLTTLGPLKWPLFLFLVRQIFGELIVTSALSQAHPWICLLLLRLILRIGISQHKIPTWSWCAIWQGLVLPFWFSGIGIGCHSTTLWSWCAIIWQGPLVKPRRQSILLVYDFYFDNWHHTNSSVSFADNEE